MAECVEQKAAGVFSGGEACLQPRAKPNQFIDFGDDELLLG